MPPKSKQGQAINPIMTLFKARIDELLQFAEQASKDLQDHMGELDPARRGQTEALFRYASSFIAFLNPKDAKEKEKIKSQFANALSRTELNWLTSFGIFGVTAVHSASVLSDFTNFLSANGKEGAKNKIEYELLSIFFYLIDLLIYISNENVHTFDLNEERFIGLHNKRKSSNFIKKRCLLLRNLISPWLEKYILQHPEHTEQAQLVKTAHELLIKAQAIPLGSMDEEKVSNLLKRIEEFLAKENLTASLPSIIAHLETNNTELVLTPTHDFQGKIESLRRECNRLQEIAQRIQEKLAQEREKEQALGSLTILIRRYKEALNQVQIQSAETSTASPSLSGSGRRRWSRLLKIKKSKSPQQKSLSQSEISPPKRVLPLLPVSSTPSPGPLKVDALQEREASPKATQGEVARCEAALLAQLQQVEGALSADALLEHVQLQKNLVLEITSLEKQEEGIKEIMHGVEVIQTRIQIIQSQLSNIVDEKQMQSALSAAVQALQLRCTGYKVDLAEVASRLRDAQQENQQRQIQQKERHVLIDKIQDTLKNFDQAGHYQQWWDRWTDLFLGWFFTSTHKKYQSYIDYQLRPALNLYGQLGDPVYADLTRIIGLGCEKFKKRLSIKTLLNDLHTALQAFKNKPLSDFQQQDASFLLTEETVVTPPSSLSAPLPSITHSQVAATPPLRSRKVLPSPSKAGVFAAGDSAMSLSGSTSESNVKAAQRNGAASQRPVYATAL